MKDSETIWAARDLIEAGWCKHALRNIHGDVCLAGAVAEVTGVYSLKTRVLRHLLETLTGSTYGCLISFNDRPTTTKQDVLDLFSKTAIRLEESGL